MFPFQYRMASLSLATALALALFGVTTPVMAAESPEGAALDLVEMVRGGDFSAIDGVVCSTQQRAVLEQFDPATSLGLSPEGTPTAGEMAFDIEGESIELISQEDDSATVRLTASLSLSVDEAQARDVVRALSEAEGEQISDADLDLVVPVMLAAFSQIQNVDEDLTITLDNGVWRVCGGIGDQVPITAIQDSTVSFEGICGLAALSEVNAVGPTELQYDSSSGSVDYCLYSSESRGGDFSTTLTLLRGDTVEAYESLFPGGTDLIIAGAPAYAETDQLFVELDEGVLEIAIFPGESSLPGFETSAYLEQLASLFSPLMGELEASDLGSVDGTLIAISEDSLCQLLDVGAINEASPVRYDDRWDGGSDLCILSHTGSDAGLPTLTVYREFVAFDNLAEIYPGGAPATVSGRSAYSDGETLWVEVGGEPIGIVPDFDGVSVGGADAIEHAADVAVIIAAAFDSDD